MYYKLSEFGVEAKRIRKSLGLNQKQVKEIVGINEETIRRTENGKTMPTIETLDLLSIVYKCDMIAVFSKYKLTFDQYFEERIKYVIPSIRLENKDAINREVENFLQEFGGSKKLNSSVINDKSLQYIEYLKAAGNLKNSFVDKSRFDITNLVKVVSDPMGKNKKKVILLDKLEIRIYVLISVIYRYRSEFDRSIRYLEVALNSVKLRYSDDKDFLYLYFLVMINLMTLYHRIDDFEALDSVYKNSLKVLDGAMGLPAITDMLIRVGVNKYNRQEKNAGDLLITALQILEDADQSDKKDKYIKSFSKRYPLVFAKRADQWGKV